MLVFITILFYLQHKQIAVLLLGGALLAAAMGVLIFSPISFSIILPLDLIPIFVLVLLMATNRETYTELVIAIKGDQEARTKERKAAKSARFLPTFRKKSTSELRTIVTDRRLVPEAIEAAEILLAEREKKG